MKRWPLPILICLTLGAITTVAVAWGCVAFGPRAELSAGDLAAGMHQSFWGWPVIRPDDGAINSFGHRRTPSHLDPGLTTDGWQLSIHDTSGWPAHSLAGTLRGRYASRTKMELPSTSVMHVGRDLALPIRPIWPGFLLNTLFYAAIWFGVFFGFTSAKRFIRSKRGRCPRCGYDLRGHRDEGTEARRHEGVEAGCPECGWGRGESPRHSVSAGF